MTRRGPDDHKSPPDHSLPLGRLWVHAPEKPEVGPDNLPSSGWLPLWAEHLADSGTSPGSSPSQICGCHLHFIEKMSLVCFKLSQHLLMPVIDYGFDLYRALALGF